MSKPTVLTPEDMVYQINEEGIGYAIQHYYGRNISCPEDPEFEAAWKAAYDAMAKVSEFVDKYKGIDR